MGEVIAKRNKNSKFSGRKIEAHHHDGLTASLSLVGESIIIAITKV
jgi:hypothetical protein